MKEKLIKNNNHSLIITTLSYLIALILILNCNTIYIFSPNFDIIRKSLIPVICIASIAYVVINIYQYKLKIDRILFIGICVTVYLCIFIFRSDLYLKNTKGWLTVINFIIFFFLVWVEKNSKVPKIITAYINIMALISIVAIFFWIFGSTFHIIHPNTYIVTSWTSSRISNRLIPSYYNLYFETQYTNLGLRNSAIFTEAPMAALNFLLALSMTVLLQKHLKFRKIKIILFIIVGLMTMSTTMYIGLLILFIFKFLDFNKNRKDKILYFILGVFFFVIASYLINSLFSSKINTISGMDRQLDYRNAFDAFEKNPFWGMGLNSGVMEGQNIINGIPVFHYGFSSSFTKILGDGGLYLTLLIIFSLLLSIGQSVLHKNDDRLIFTIILFYLFMVNMFAQTYIMYYLFIFISIWNPYSLLNIEFKKSY